MAAIPAVCAHLPFKDCDLNFANQAADDKMLFPSLFPGEACRGRVN
jgi:hypothetical protein